MAHGGTVKLCSNDGCMNLVVQGGVCRRHGAKVTLCSNEGCTNQIVQGGVCWRHGAKITKKVKRCSYEGCINRSRRRGACKRHGAYHDTNDGSTAFGSEFEQATADRSLPNDRSTRPSIIGQGVAQGVPEEVAILCQEIFEV